MHSGPPSSQYYIHIQTHIDVHTHIYIYIQIQMESKSHSDSESQACFSDDLIVVLSQAGPALATQPQITAILESIEYDLRKNPIMFLIYPTTSGWL